jgi:hypothetical protein
MKNFNRRKTAENSKEISQTANSPINKTIPGSSAVNL